MSGTLEDVIRRCKCSVHLTVNGHRTSYQSVTAYFKEQRERGNDCDLSEDDISAMQECNSIYQLICYDRNNVGSYEFYGVCLADVVRQALEVIK